MEISVDYVNQPVIKRRRCERMVAYMQRISRMAKKQDLFACQKGVEQDTGNQEIK